MHVHRPALRLVTCLGRTRVHQLRLELWTIQSLLIWRKLQSRVVQQGLEQETLQT